MKERHKYMCVCVCLCGLVVLKQRGMVCVCIMGCRPSCAVAVTPGEKDNGMTGGWV